MEPDKPLAVVREIVRVIKSGGGILGKTAMIIGLLIVCVGIALFRVPPEQIILILALGALIFFLWFGPILWLVNKYPEKAFLDGQAWVEHHQQVTLAAKGQSPILIEPTSTPEPGLPLQKEEATQRKP